MNLLPTSSCAGSDCGCGQPATGASWDRRQFLKALGITAGTMAVPSWPAMAGPFTRADFEKLVPRDKKLSPEWVKSLTARGERSVYRGAELGLIGMPVGGLCAGQVYLGGDGQLWHWDIFNQHLDSGSGGPHYAKPMKPGAPFDQGFALQVIQDGKSQVRRLNAQGWRDITFNGEYPVGTVEYREADFPVSVRLEAFSPFIPLNTDDSSLPAIVMRFSVRNEGVGRLKGNLGGWLENAVSLYSAERISGRRRNRIGKRGNLTYLECSAEVEPTPARSGKRPDIVFDQFERATYDPWVATGEAFGAGPVELTKVPDYQGDLHAQGHRVVNSHASSPGTNSVERDAGTGTLTSPVFTIERDYVTFLIGGGAHKGRTCIDLVIDGKTVLSATGKNDNRMQPHTFDVRPWAGREARLRILDEEKGGWGNIGIDDIVFSDDPRGPSLDLKDQGDFGTMVLGLAGAAARGARADLRPGPWHEAVFAEHQAVATEVATRPFGEKLTGGLAAPFELAAGASTEITFVLGWYFPNLRIDGLKDTGGRWYGSKFKSAMEVADYVGSNLERLTGETFLWRQTWYDSTLPYWFLDRTMLNTSILATSTCHRFASDRFYAWEGVGCCAGTCTHVWHYAHAMGRLFPDLERSLREKADYGAGFNPDTGRIRFRAEHNDHWAVDGQSGVILRTYREHEASADDAFLRRVWPKAKKALEFLINQDAKSDGILDGPQHNTLDTDWWGEIAWLSGLYLAALRAGEEMAREQGDTEFADRCHGIFDQGRRLLVERLYNGEYFINKVDASHLDAINSGTGCHIDQVFAQSWAFQVGLGRVLPEAETSSALKSLWTYNFTPDVGPYRAAYKAGRWYAMPGEAGLLMCSFPQADWDYANAKGKGPDWAAGYFNECMNGFEYQVAGHMIWEGMLTEGLAITRAIHDRYHPARRNPWNEIECGDHYARSMASYGVYLAACGYEYHGPHGRLGFDPRLTAGAEFKGAFTAAEGWGTFSSKRNGTANQIRLDLKWGKLRLTALSVGLPGELPASGLRASLNGQPCSAAVARKGRGVQLVFARSLDLKAGDSLVIEG